MNAYIPRIPGKEARKSAPAKEGILGVEGLSREILLKALEKAGALEERQEEKKEPQYTAGDLFRLGLTGKENSRQRRRDFLSSLELPEYLSNKALLQYMNSAPPDFIARAIASLAEEEEDCGV